MHDREPNPQKSLFGKVEKHLDETADWYSAQARKAYQQGKTAERLLNSSGSSLLRGVADPIRLLRQVEEKLRGIQQEQK